MLRHGSQGGPRPPAGTHSSPTCFTPCCAARSIWLRCPTQSICSGCGTREEQQGTCRVSVEDAAAAVRQQAARGCRQAIGRLAHPSCGPARCCAALAASAAPHLLPGLVVPLWRVVWVARGPHLGHGRRQNDQVGAARQPLLPRLGLQHISQHHTLPQLRLLLLPPAGRRRGKAEMEQGR